MNKLALMFKIDESLDPNELIDTLLGFVDVLKTPSEMKKIDALQIHFIGKEKKEKIDVKVTEFPFKK